MSSCNWLSRMVARGAIFMVLIGGLAACGGGGGGEAGDAGGQMVFTADYAPVNNGDKHLWQLTSVPVPELRYRVVGAAVQLSGRTVFPLRDETGETSYLASNTEAQTLVPAPGADPLSDLLGPVDVLRFGLAPGQSVTLLDRTVSLDLDQDRLDDTVQLRVDLLVVGLGPLQTARERFAETAEIRITALSTTRLASGAVRNVRVVSTEWYARGIGLVRSSTQTLVDGVVDSTEAEEILAYGVGTRRSDASPPNVVASMPADAAFVGVVSTVSLTFNEPIDPATLSAVGGVQVLDEQGRSVVAAPPLISLSGTEVTLPLAPALPSGRYTVRMGTGVSDFAGNRASASERSFIIDTTGPQLIATTPVDGDNYAAGTGVVSMTFNEDIRSDGLSAPFIELSDQTGRVAAQRLSATISGRTLTATIATALGRDSVFRMTHSGLTDLAGNALPYGANAVTFKADPGPLDRVEALAPGLYVSTVRRGDLDGDGLPDLVFVANDRASRATWLAMRAGRLGGGYGATQLLVSLLGPGISVCDARALAMGDFDADGRMDVALPCGPFLRVWRQVSGGQFVMELPGYNGSMELAAADIDGNGRADLVLVGTPPGLDVGAQAAWHAITRQPNGSWTSLSTIDIGGDMGVPLQAILADLNADGQADAVWTRRFLDGRIELAWALRQGGGFGPVQSRAVAMTSELQMYNGLAVGDLDGDGRADILVGGRFTTSASVGVFLGGSGGGFGDPQWRDLQTHVGAMALADVNADGRADVVLSLPLYPSLAVLLQLPNGALDVERRYQRPEIDPPGPRDIFMTDVDGNGLPDLIMQGDVFRRRPFMGEWPLAAAAPPRARALGSGVLRRDLAAPLVGAWSGR